MLFVQCDIVHPESGEVIAEPGKALNVSSPRAQHVLAVCEEYSQFYSICQDDDSDMIIIKPV